MSANRQALCRTNWDTPSEGLGRPERAMMLVPVAIVTCGTERRPVERLTSLQSAVCRAVGLVAEIGRVPHLVKSHVPDWTRRPLGSLRAGASALTHR